MGPVDRDVAPEPRPGHTHARVVQIVVGPVRGTDGMVLLRRAGNRRQVSGRLAAGVIEIPLSQGAPQTDEDQHAQRGREPVPADGPVEPLSAFVVQRSEHGPYLRPLGRLGHRGHLIEERGRGGDEAWPRQAHRPRERWSGSESAEPPPKLSEKPPMRCRRTKMTPRYKPGPTSLISSRIQRAAHDV